MELYLDAFWELTNTRQVGYGVIGPIGWLSVHEYAVANEYDATQREDLLYYIRVLDNEYLRFKSEEAKRGNK